mgnify:CR=1 FL=1
MEDRLEKYIRENREAFDAYEPLPEVWEKIVLKEDRNKTRKINWMKVFLRAAAVILIFIISYFAHDYIKSRDKEQISDADKTAEKPSGCIIPEDLKETQYYYTGLINEKFRELKQYTKQSPEIAEEIKRDFNELDSIYGGLKNDLCEEVASEEVIEAMIQNYRIKLELLEDVLFQIKKVQNIKTNTHEPEEYEL